MVSLDVDITQININDGNLKTHSLNVLISTHVFNLGWSFHIMDTFDNYSTEEKSYILGNKFQITN